VSDVSVVIPSRSDAGGLEALLRSLDLQSLPWDRFEVVVESDPEGDDARARHLTWLAGHRPNMHVVGDSGVAGLAAVELRGEVALVTLEPVSLLTDALHEVAAHAASGREADGNDRPGSGVVFAVRRLGEGPGAVPALAMDRTHLDHAGGSVRSAIEAASRALEGAQDSGPRVLEPLYVAAPRRDEPPAGRAGPVHLHSDVAWREGALELKVAVSIVDREEAGEADDASAVVEGAAGPVRLVARDLSSGRTRVLAASNPSGVDGGRPTTQIVHVEAVSELVDWLGREVWHLQVEWGAWVAPVGIDADRGAVVGPFVVDAARQSGGVALRAAGVREGMLSPRAGDVVFTEDATGLAMVLPMEGSHVFGADVRAELRIGDLAVPARLVSGDRGLELRALVSGLCGRYPLALRAGGPVLPLGLVLVLDETGRASLTAGAPRAAQSVPSSTGHAAGGPLDDLPRRRDRSARIPLARWIPHGLRVRARRWPLVRRLRRVVTPT
jgi:hypothetical protein